MKSIPVSEIVKRDHWSAATGINPRGLPLILRFRPGFRQLQDFAGYGELLRIVWRYKHPHPSGMPEDEEALEALEFENALAAAMERDLLAVLAAVITSNGATEWVFYTGDVEECGERVNALPQKEEPYPIELTAQADPDWAFLREQVLADCREERE